jgi:hypothetical protein
MPASWAECLARRSRDRAVSGRNGRGGNRDRSGKNETRESASEIGASALSRIVQIYHVSSSFLCMLITRTMSANAK